MPKPLAIRPNTNYGGENMKKYSTEATISSLQTQCNKYGFMILCRTARQVKVEIEGQTD